ncbi:MAG: hypothetical protein AAFZ02_10955 [Pseudomonadota bacterium]
MTNKKGAEAQIDLEKCLPLAEHIEAHADRANLAQELKREQKLRIQEKDGRLHVVTMHKVTAKGRPDARQALLNWAAKVRRAALAAA